MQPAEAGELISQLRLGPCRNNFKSGEILDLAAIGEKGFVIAHA